MKHSQSIEEDKGMKPAIWEGMASHWLVLRLKSGGISIYYCNDQEMTGPYYWLWNQTKSKEVFDTLEDCKKNAVEFVKDALRQDLKNLGQINA
jgi:hypothetical protein